MSKNIIVIIVALLLCFTAGMIVWRAASVNDNSTPKAKLLTGELRAR